MNKLIDLHQYAKDVERDEGAGGESRSKARNSDGPGIPPLSAVRRSEGDRGGSGGALGANDTSGINKGADE